MLSPSPTSNQTYGFDSLRSPCGQPLAVYNCIIRLCELSRRQRANGAAAKWSAQSAVRFV
jgi:hypothetical protein